MFCCITHSVYIFGVHHFTRDFVESLELLSLIGALNGLLILIVLVQVHWVFVGCRQTCVRGVLRGLLDCYHLPLGLAMEISCAHRHFLNGLIPMTGTPHLVHGNYTLLCSTPWHASD